MTERQDTPNTAGPQAGNNGGREARPAAPEMRRPGYPFSALRQEMDRLFESFMGEHPVSMFGEMPLARHMRPEAPVIAPHIDIAETDGKLVLSAELPGLSEEDISLEIEDNLLTLSGEKQISREDKNETRHVSERRYGRFERRIGLPQTVDATAAEAELKNGVLTVTLPKRVEEKETVKTIKVKSA